MNEQLITVEEIQKHSSEKDCWICVDDVVWDITDFAKQHPGGSDIIYRYAGLDASMTYNTVHSPKLIRNTLGPGKCRGKLDRTNIPENSDWLKPPQNETARPELKVGAKPPLSSIINSHDLEKVAERTLTKKAWAFYSSAATDLITKEGNKRLFDRILLRPRILRNVRDVDTKTSILGQNVALPFFVSPTAMAKLAHPDGELALAKGANKFGIAQCVRCSMRENIRPKAMLTFDSISSNASYTMSEITSSAPNIPQFFQLYVNKDRSASEALLKDAERSGIKGVFVTVDGPVQGKREADERVRVEAPGALATAAISGVSASNDSRGGGLGRTMGTYIDPTFNWSDIAWLRRVTKLPIVVKGIQTAEDAIIACRYGVDGILVSNHGGRNLDTSPPSILTLLEIRKHCPEVFTKLEVYVDSGIRRGTDIVKALCLGAKAVGMGRPFLYSLVYGQDGVEHLIDIMKDELETTMRLLGITDISQASPKFLNTCDVDHLVPKYLHVPSKEEQRHIVAKL